MGAGSGRDSPADSEGDGGGTSRRGETGCESANAEETRREGREPGGSKEATPPRPFAAALLRGSGIIAEIKRRSPSRGEIRPGLVPGELARTYEEGGAAAVSVLTETEHFGGSLDDLREVRGATSLPILRKDFLVHPEELGESKRAGADAVLLIAGMLSDEELTVLLRRAETLGLEALVEIHHESELDRAVAAGAKLIGINNRDLVNLTVDLDTSRRILPQVPPARVAVVESGLSSRQQITAFLRMGARGFLMGESLLLAPDPGAKLMELTGGNHAENQGEGVRHHQSR